MTETTICLRPMSDAPRDGTAVLAIQDGHYFPVVTVRFRDFPSPRWVGVAGGARRDLSGFLCTLPAELTPETVARMAADLGALLPADPAAEVAALRAENERLRASNGELHADLYGSQDGSLLRDTQGALERAEARVAALKQALRGVRERIRTEGSPGRIGAISIADGALPEIVALLDRALSETE